ncbi:MAG: hypothetical protein NUV56_05015, partial [Candidatus Uhrbacteria bacterium]|nr:hypothetical protein [Candidatus Uhrbacteria bacterium]
MKNIVTFVIRGTRPLLMNRLSEEDLKLLLGKKGDKPQPKTLESKTYRDTDGNLCVLGSHILTSLHYGVRSMLGRERKGLVRAVQNGKISAPDLLTLTFPDTDKPIRGYTLDTRRSFIRPQPGNVTLIEVDEWGFDPQSGEEVVVGQVQVPMTVIEATYPRIDAWQIRSILSIDEPINVDEVKIALTMAGKCHGIGAFCRSAYGQFKLIEWNGEPV